MRIALLSLVMALSALEVSAEASNEAKPRTLPEVLGAVPKGERAFLHAVITAEDIAAIPPGDEKMIREISAGEGDDGYLHAIYLIAALIEGRELGAAGVVIGKPMLRTQTLVDKRKTPYAVVTTIEVDFVSRSKSGGSLGRLFFADEPMPARKTCRGGTVVVTSEEVQKSARWPSRLQLMEAMSRKAGADRIVTALRFEPAQRGGRKLRGELRTVPVDGLCPDEAKHVGAIKLKRKHRHFYARLVVNGVDLGDALVDTGASSLALPEKLAALASVEVTGRAKADTASATIDVKKGVADVVTIGGMSVRSVDVIILPDGTDALIGMAVLEAFDIAFSGDTMTLTAR